MNTALNNAPKQKTGLWWKALLALLLLLLTTLFILSNYLNSIAHTQINRALNTFLVAGGTLDNVDLQLATGQIDLSGLTINSPEAFGSRPLLKLNSLHLNLGLSALLSGDIAIDELALEGASFTLVRNAQGELSILNLIPPSDTDKIKTTSTEEQKTFSIPSIHIDAVRFDNASLLIIDQFNKKQWIGKSDINLKIENLNIKDLMNGEILTGKIELALNKLKLDQPENAEGDKLLSLDQLSITSNALDLSASEFKINQIFLSGFHSSISVQSNGVSNLGQLSDALFGASQSSAQANINKHPETQTDLPRILIEEIKLENSSLNYLNNMITGTPLAFPLNNIQIEVSQLRLFNQNTQLPPASVAISFQLEQPGKLPSAYFGALAKIGPIGPGIPQGNAQIHITGFKLDTLGSLVSPTARKALGATGVDAGAALALDTETIKLQASVFSDRGIHYNVIKMQGPLTNPNIEIGAIFSGVYQRVSGALFNIGKGGLNAGGSIALDGVNIAKSAGDSAISIGKNMGENLFEVGQGLVTRDKGEVLNGLDGSSKGTFFLAADSVTGAGSTTTDGLMKSAGDFMGASTVERWNAEIPARFNAGIEQAKKALSNMPYPPETH